MYYKCVFKNNGRLRSTNALLSDTIYCQADYVVGEWILPPIDGSGLFVFKELSDAERFIQDIYGNPYRFRLNEIEIYSCQVRNPRQCKFMYEYPGATKSINDFWNDIRKARKAKTKLETNLYYSIEPPKGTYLANAVKLMEKVICTTK